jgi:hypothetical protein
MRRKLDELLAAPGLTQRRFVALAVVSLLATSTVVAAGLQADGTPYGLLAAAYARPAPTVEVAAATPAPRPTPAAQAATTTPAATPAPSSAATPSQSSPAPAVPTPTTPQPSQPAPAQPAPVAPKAVSKVKHVFVISVAGGGYDPTWGAGSAATYLNGTLRPQGRLLEGYHPLAAGDLATHIALVGGQKPSAGITQGCPTYGGDCLLPVETLSLPDQLVSSGRSWRGYFEDMSNGADAVKSCRHPNAGAADDTGSGRPGDEYTTRHNPFVYFRSLTDLGECLTNDLPLDSLATDLASEKTTPNFVFVAPNLCHGGWESSCADGSAGGLPAADAFLAEWAPKILESAAYKADGLLIVLFGGQPGTTPPDANTGALLVSPFAQAGTGSQAKYDPYSMLRSVEDLFGLSNLGQAADTTVPSFASSELSAGLSTTAQAP